MDTAPANYVEESATMDENDTEFPTSTGLNRRTVLKGAAVGGALWAVPSVLSLSPASASAGSAQPCGAFDCNNLVNCVASPDCYCAQLHGQSGTDCLDHGYCLGNGQNICATDADCEAVVAGTVCIDYVANSCAGDCADGSTTLCGTVCSKGEARKQARGRRPVLTALHS